MMFALAIAGLVALTTAVPVSDPLPRCGPRGCWFYYVNEETQECGLANARPRMPDAVVDSPALMAEYIAATEKFYTVPVGGDKSQHVKLGNCAEDTPYTVLRGGVTRTAPWPLDPLPMFLFCADRCGCRPGNQLPGVDIFPPCTDAENATKSPICSMCGPKANEPTPVLIFIKSPFPPPPPPPVH